MRSMAIACIMNSEKQKLSPSGNWTPVSRVTGGDTDHYTNEEWEKGIPGMLKM